jgi:hypothetical protein
MIVGLGAIVFGAVSLAACLVPAIRVTRDNAVALLRAD